MQAGFREGIRSQKLEFFVVCNAKYGFWGEVDRVDFLVHLHNIVFCLGQWHFGRFLQQFKGATSVGPPFSLSFCDRDGDS